MYFPPEAMPMKIFHYKLNDDDTYGITIPYDDKTIKGKAGDDSNIVPGRFIHDMTYNSLFNTCIGSSISSAFTGFPFTLMPSSSPVIVQLRLTFLIPTG